MELIDMQSTLKDDYVNILLRIRMNQMNNDEYEIAFAIGDHTILDGHTACPRAGLSVLTGMNSCGRKCVPP